MKIGVGSHAARINRMLAAVTSAEGPFSRIVTSMEQSTDEAIANLHGTTTQIAESTMEECHLTLDRIIEDRKTEDQDQGSAGYRVKMLGWVQEAENFFNARVVPMYNLCNGRGGSE
jgi:hypothetical protein